MLVTSVLAVAPVFHRLNMLSMAQLHMLHPMQHGHQVLTYLTVRLRQ